MVMMVSAVCVIIGANCLEVVRSQVMRALVTLAMAVLAGAIFPLAFPDPDIEFKGPATQETVAVGFCYFSMLLGMAAQYCYKQVERGDTKFTFEPMEFLMPIFASPIVFIPLLTLTTDIALSGPFTKSKLMVYLVAFQNGFFWKSFFEERRQKTIERPSLA
jgi:hypothetical protein